MQQSDEQKPKDDMDEKTDVATGGPVSRREFLKIAGIAGAAVSLGAGLGGLMAACGEAEEATTTTAAATTTTAAATTTTAAVTTTTAAGSTTTAASAIGAYNAMIDEEWAKLTDLSPIVLPPDILESPKAVPGKKIYGVPITLSCDTCQMTSKTYEKCCELLGWGFTTGEFGADENKFAAAIDQAIGMKVDGLDIWVIDAKTILEPLRKAKKAGIPILASFSVDTEEDLYMSQGSKSNFAEERGWNTWIAAYKLDGQASGKPMKILTFLPPGSAFAVTAHDNFKIKMDEAIAAGVQAEILAVTETNVAEEATVLPGKAISVVRANADYTSAWCAADNTAIQAMTGLRSVGLDDSSKIWVSTDATASFLENMKAGGPLKASFGSPVRYCAWVNMNDFNRIFSGLAPLGGDALYPAKMIYKDNAPATGEWDDYQQESVEAEFRKIWGV